MPVKSHITLKFQSEIVKNYTDPKNTIPNNLVKIECFTQSGEYCKTCL